jgi:glycosyltransferase involved in cell wall biosynthesis
VRPAILRTGHVLTVSRASRTVIASWLEDERVEIHVTGEGTSDVFTPVGEVAQLDRPYFLYVGNMRRHKNPQVFFDAVAGLPDHRAIVVTSDPDEARSAATSAQITERTSILTGVDDLHLAALYRGAEALVFPSLEEGFGLPPLEAIRSGCPVVHFSGCAAVSELCGDDGPGAVASATDAATWRAAMLQAEGPTARQVAAGARHTWEAAAATVDSVLRELSHA